MKKLVGEGKPFHSAVDKTAALLKRKSGTGAEFMKELMGVSGVKPTELQERGLTDIMGMPKMTHEQFMAALGSKPTPDIEEKVLGEEPEQPSKTELRKYANNLIGTRAREYASEASDTSGEYRTLLAEEMRRLRSNHMDHAMLLAKANLKNNREPAYHETYTLPGGEKYREMLIKLPRSKERETFAGVSAHFGYEPNILASMRLKDRTGPNGEKLLHLEELQSDWHQQGREKGYQGDIPELTPEQKERIEELGGKIRHGLGTSAEIDESKALRDQAVKRLKAIPDAPFKKNWEEMALKRLIHHAAEKGYHGIVVTPGKEQADRYSLAKYIDSIMLVPNPHPNANSRPYYYKAFNKQGDRVADDTVDEQLLSQHIGKEAAEKLLSQKPNPMGERMISGANLVTGDEGMKGFYDKKVPNILNSIGKKYGVKTQLGGIPLQTKPERIKTTSEGRTPLPAETANLHHFPITEEMRKDVLTNGLPLYSQGGKVHMAEGGDMDQMQMAVMNQKIKKPKKPPTPLHFDPAPALKKADIETHAERITRQMAGLENPNKKTLQQLAREQGLQVDIKSGGKKTNLPVIDYSKLGKNAFTVGVPGDPSIGGIVLSKNMKRRHDMQYPKAGEYLRGVGGVPLENEVPMYGGYMYGGYGHPAGWASDLGASAGMFNVVKKLAEEDPTRDIYGHYHKMTPESLNHAVHIMDAVLMHHRPHRQPPEKIELLNHLMRNVQLTKSDKDKPYPSFPGFENVADVMLHGSVDSDMRKKIINLLSTEKYMPGGKQKMDDLIYASSHPELRNIETGAGGSGILKFDPSGDLKASLSRHPTYGNDIPSSLIGKTRYTTPFQILAPRSHYRATQEIKAMGKKVDPFNMAKMSIIREPIDEQYINQMGEYENAMRKRLGYKKGGVIKKANGGQVDVTSIGVNEAPNMDVKAFFPPRPAQGNILPVGGIQQAQQAPLQPQQPPQAPQQAPGQPPMQPNQPGQQLRQPPSNILQMTPQGQAMSAIKPPQMARGGQVDRDTMMLALMNRNKKVKYG
jgi:hypothetical protein